MPQPVTATRESPVSRAVGVSAVVPVFNSASSLDPLCERVDAALTSAPGVNAWELILVNDGSEDGSWEVIQRISRRHPQVRGLDLTRNWGQHNALLAGIHAARHELIVTLDDDLQNPPEEIVRLLDALTPGVDVVYGIPTRSSHPAYRRIGAIGLRTILRAITRRREALEASGFRAFRASLIDGSAERGGRRVVLEPMLRGRTRRIESIPVRHDPRRSGSSNYSLAKLIRFAITEIAADLPIRRDHRQERSYAVRAATESRPGADVK